jgi:hypothetical protein
LVENVLIIVDAHISLDDQVHAGAQIALPKDQCSFGILLFDQQIGDLSQRLLGRRSKQISAFQRNQPLDLAQHGTCHVIRISFLCSASAKTKYKRRQSTALSKAGSLAA